MIYQQRDMFRIQILQAMKIQTRYIRSVLTRHVQLNGYVLDEQYMLDTPCKLDNPYMLDKPCKLYTQ